MAAISWKLTLVTLAGIVPVIVVAVGYAVRVRELSKRYQKLKGQASQVAEEAIANVRTVKAFAGEKNE